MKTKKLISIICTLSFAAMPIFAEDGAPKQEQPANAESQTKLPESFKNRMLKQFDKDGDGYLNEAELAEAKASLKERRKRFEEMQKKHAEGVLKEFDKDGDGKLSAEELVPLIEKQRRMFADMSSRRGRPDGFPQVRGERLRPKGAMMPPPPNAGGETPPPPPNADEAAPRQKQLRPDRRQMRPERPRFRHPMPEDLDELALPKAEAKAQ